LNFQAGPVLWNVLGSYQFLFVLTARSSTSYCMRLGSALLNRFERSPIYKNGPFSETLTVTGPLNQPSTRNGIFLFPNFRLSDRIVEPSPGAIGLPPGSPPSPNTAKRQSAVSAPTPQSPSASSASRPPHIRAIKRLDRFTLRGKIKVNIQWMSYCLVHNIGKIMSYGFA
jgi:hypothetical protein